MRLPTFLPSLTIDAIDRTATQLSPHLKFGTLSCRTFYHRVSAINAAAKTHSTPPESLLGQLLWREFFHSNSESIGANYNQIKGNNLSRYIDWDLQTRYGDDGAKLPKEEQEKIWKEEEPEAWERLQAWKEGRTGFPWIVSGPSLSSRRPRLDSR